MLRLVQRSVRASAASNHGSSSVRASSLWRNRGARGISNVVVTRDNGLPDLIITPLAAKKLVEAAKKQNAPQLMLRVAVEGGGCSGFKYVYEFDQNEADGEEDIVFEKDGGKVVIDKESLEFVRGSTVDFEQELIRSAFVVTNNPRAVSGCGCGTSFDLKD
uniref:Core domain-containing protein n=1 Tax=Globisporangium ultimum (strain ATCC 200006 / CBS 805.95 / DAOM BR144) TaxID=431595 RepID=K3WJH5_GLOUD